MRTTTRQLFVPVLAAIWLAAPTAAVPSARTALALAREETASDVSSALEELRAETGVPALVALAVQDGEIVARGAAGVRVFGSEDAVTPADPFHLGSCSKAMTATLVARLIEEEVLTWETTVAEALPELAAEIDPGFHAVTIEQLLRHRGGIAERRRPELQPLIALFYGLEGSPREQRRGAVRLALEKPPYSAPGEAYDYSNYGYMTAAAMIERLTDRSWEELIVEKVFRPLGMESAGVGSPSGADVPVGHDEDGDSWKPLPPGPGGILPESMGPAGLVHASLEDWARFVSDHLAGERGADGLLRSATYRRLHRDPEKSGYACGWAIQQYDWGWDSGRALAHDGSDGTWYTAVLALPEWDVIVLAAANGAGTAGTAAVTRARDHLLEEIGFAP